MSPAYYRVGDPTTGQGARMLSGEEERAELAAEQRTQVAATANVAPSSVAGQESAIPQAPAGTVCKCGASLAPGAKFCSECGEKVKPAGCPKCGNPDAKGKFCSECGTAL